MITDTTYQKANLGTYQAAIGFFLVAAVLGTLMRFMYLQEILYLEYKNVLHAHSHIAMLGWGFTALAGVLVFVFTPNVETRKVYQNTLYANLFAGLGMLFSFLYQGYGAISIAFCTVHVFVVYYFSWYFLKDLKKVPPTIATKFAKWAIYLMVISTIGLWSIAPISMFLGKLHPLYFASIQFFLHMQFNGWFTFGILALLFKLSEKNGHVVHLPKGTLPLLWLSLIFTYSLSITWSTPMDILFYLNSTGVILQIVAFLLIAKGFYKSVDLFFSTGSLSSWMLRLGLVSLALKVIVQSAVVLPFIAKVSYTIRNFVIGFIHLTMLGAFSLSLIGILIHLELLPRGRMASMGYRLIVFGFLSTEAVLFLQGILLWAGKGFITNYHSIIFIATALLPIGLLSVFIASLKSKKHLTI